MNPELSAIFAKTRKVTSELNKRHGTVFGIACEQGLFAVTETTKDGRKEVTKQLTGLQTYGECVAYMEGLLA